MIGNSVFEPTCTKCVETKRYKATYITGIECSVGGEHQVVSKQISDYVIDYGIDGDSYSTYVGQRTVVFCWKCNRKVVGR